MLVQVVRALFETQCERKHFASMCDGVRVSVAGTAQREREWAEGTMSSLPGMLNFQNKIMS